MILTFIFKAHLLATFSLTGLIWLVQRVHYPAYNFIARDSFADYQRFHMKRISTVVMPLMLLEIISALALVSLTSENLFLWNLVGIILTWLSTFTLSVPAHKKLLQEKNEKCIRFLILSNWPRTLLWSARTGLLLYGVKMQLYL